MIFADTMYWIALWNLRDRRHGEAMRLTADVGATPIVTTEFVLLEALAGMARMGPDWRSRSEEAIQSLRDDPQVDIVPASPELVREGIERYARRPDHESSGVDCTSFCVMERMGITEVLTRDRDFRREGFVTLFDD